MANQWEQGLLSDRVVLKVDDRPQPRSILQWARCGTQSMITFSLGRGYVLALTVENGIDELRVVQANW